MKAKVLSVRDENIGVVSPFIHGLKAFWGIVSSEKGGIFEGKAGREISLQSYRSNFSLTLPRESWKAVTGQSKG